MLPLPPRPVQVVRAARYSKEPSADFTADSDGFLQCDVDKHKTSNMQRKKAKLLPLVALGHGVAAEPWGLVWLEARAKGVRRLFGGHTSRRTS